MSRAFQARPCGLAWLVALALSTSTALADDTPKAGPPAQEPPANPGKTASQYTLPGEDPVQPFVPLKPRTVEDRKQLEALTNFSVARALESRRNWTDAVQLLEKALVDEPDSVTIPRRLSRLCFILGRTDAAVRFSRKVLELEPGDTETIVRLVNYYNNRRNSPVEAEGLLKEVLANPKLAENSGGRLVADFELGRLYAGKLQKPEAAAEAYARVIEALDRREANRLNPADIRRVLGGDEAAAYQEFGLAFLQTKRYDLAVKAFEHGLDYDPDDPQLPLLLAQTLVKVGDNERALRLVEQFLKRQPQGIEGYSLLAEILTALKRGDEITPRLEEAAKRDPKNAALQYVLADRYEETGQVDRANALRKQLLETQPTTQGYAALAASLLKRKKAEDLLKIITKAITRPNGLEAMQEPIRGLIADRTFAGEVIDAGRKLLEADPPALERQGVAVLSYIATRTEQLDKFLPIQRLELKRNPNPQAFREVVLLLTNLKRYGDAASTIEEMMDKFPAERNPRVLVEQVRLYRLADQPEPAEKAARAALKLDANDLDAQIQLGALLSTTGRNDEAVAILKETVKRQPNNPAVSSLLGNVLVQAGKNEEAMDLFNQMLKQHPNDEEVIRTARSNLSIIYVNLGDYGKGEAELEALLERNPDDPGVNNDLGYLYAEQGKNLEKAEAMIRKAVAALADDPENSSYSAYLDSLGWVLFKRGKAKEAVEPLEKAAKKQSETGGTDATIFEHLGDVYFQLQDNVKARQAWLEAEKAASKSKPPDKRLTEIRKKLETLNKLGNSPKPASGNNP